MEKPSPTYDSSSRLTRQLRRDPDAYERYMDRMTARGIKVIGDNGGESDVPVWRGDHSFNSEAATYSLMHFIEPEVALEHPDWSHAQVRELAIDQFKARLEQDLSFEHKETAHEESVVHWRPVQTSSGNVELATEYGGKMVTLSQLWERTKEFSEFIGNPEAYNKQEHEAQLLMQDELLHGSSNGFVSVLSHPDAIRYVQVWQKSESGDVKSQQIDLYATTGKDFSVDEAKNLMHHLSEFHHVHTQEDPIRETNSYAHFFVAKGSVYVEDIRTIAIAQSSGGEDGHALRETRIFRSQERISHTPIVIDSTHSVSRIATYVREQIDEKIKALKRNLRVPRESKIETRSANKEIRISKGKQSNETNKALHIPAGEHTSPVVSPNLNSFEDPKSVMSEWLITHTLISYAPVLPVASVATMHWFAFLEEKEKNIGVRQTLRAPEKPRNNGMQERMFSGIPVEIMWRAMITRMHRMLGKSPEEKTDIHMTAGDNRFAITSHDKHVRDEQHFVTDTRNISHWMEAMQLLTRLFFLPQQDAYPHSNRDTIRKKIPDVFVAQEHATESQTVIFGRFMFALIFSWIITHDVRPEHPKSHTTKKILRDSKQDTVSTNELTEIRRTPWIMLAIIRYLVMLRESGQPGVPVANPQKNGGRPKRKRKKGDLPQRGIIFAIAS